MPGTKESELEYSPLVSIGLPVYNGAKNLKDSINSLLCQDYPNLEILISDNCSTDSTGEIAQEYARAYPMVSYYRQKENIGAPGNFSSVFGSARGKYFMWASDHDLWSTSLISSGVKIMEEDSSVVLCCPRVSWLTREGICRPVNDPVIDTRSPSLLPACRVMVAAWGLVSGYQTYGLFRAEALEKAMPCKKIFGPDLVLLCELACLGTWAEIPGETFYLRQLAEFSDFLSQFKKLRLDLKAHSPVTLYWQFISAHLQLVGKHFKSPLDRLHLFCGLLHCMLMKYGWVPSVISQALKKQRNIERASRELKAPGPALKST